MLNDKRTSDKRHDFTMRVRTEERRRILQSATNARWGLGTFVAAAMLAFEAHDRESQIALVMTHGDADTLRGLPYWKIPVPLVIGIRVSTWSFPLFCSSQIVRAACLSFIELPTAEQHDWIHEFFVFTGDPRQAPKPEAPA